MDILVLRGVDRTLRDKYHHPYRPDNLILHYHSLRTRMPSLEISEYSIRQYLSNFVKKLFQSEDISNHPAWKFLDSFDCGFSVADRIIGGNNANLGQFPWIVRLGYSVHMFGVELIEWQCGGVLLSDRHVMTAAHCVDQHRAGDESELSMVRIGEYNTDTNADCQLEVCAPPVQDRRLKTMISHPDFQTPPFHNDIAVLSLDSPVQINDYATPICLPRGDQLKELKIGEYVTAAGWGKMNMTTQQIASILQFISLPVVELEACNYFGKKFKMNRSQVCAGGLQNKDACGGDSGGPLTKVFDTPEGPKHVLVGVVSFGPAVCGIKKPAVYTFVPYFMKWILNNIMESNKMY